MAAFFRQLPASVNEDSMIDGCTKIRSFWSIALPMVRPARHHHHGRAVCGVSWNDYAFSSALGGPEGATLPVAAGALVPQSGIDLGLRCALGVVIATPMLIAGLAVRSHSSPESPSRPSPANSRPSSGATLNCRWCQLRVAPSGYPGSTWWLRGRDAQGASGRPVNHRRLAGTRSV